MRFIGVDLAWSSKNPSGLALIVQEKDTLVVSDARTAMTDDEIIEYIKEHSDDTTIITIDAPLVVPNETGRREAERICSELFRKYHAGAHPSNRQRLSMWTGSIRGEDIMNRLTDIGFAHEPMPSGTQSAFFEVYPHPSMVVLFNLERIIPYKSKPKRTYDMLWEAFEFYQEKLRSLTNPSLTIPDEFLPDANGVRGKALKAIEDAMDAIFCAYLAAYVTMHPDQCAILGSLEEGYITTPIFPFMKKQLSQKQQTLL